MVYDFHVTSPVNEKTVPSLGLSVYKGSNEKIHQNLKYCKVLYELQSHCQRGMHEARAMGRKIRERFNHYDDRNY